MENFVRLLVFIFLSIFFVGLVDREFRKQLMSYAQRVLRDAAHDGQQSLHHIEGLWEKDSPADLNRLVNMVGHTSLLAVKIPAYPIIIIIQLLTGVIAYLLLFVLATLRKLTCGCTSLFVLTGFMFLVLTNGHAGALNHLADSAGKLIVDVASPLYKGGITKSV